MKVHCSICQNSNAVIPQDSYLSLYKCCSCVHTFKDAPKEEKEQYSQDYYLETHKNWFNNANHQLFEFINKKIKKEKGKRNIRLLDVGCGNGNFLKYLKKKNSTIELYGIDLSYNQYLGINFIKGDILNDKIEMKFDIICSTF